MAYNDFPPNVPHFSSGVAAIMGVVGTLGTSDTGGTAKVLPIGVNPATGAMYTEGAGGTFTVGGTVPVLTKNAIIGVAYDTINITYPTGTTEVYQYLSSSGTVGTVTTTYSDTTKGSITSVVRT